MDSTQYIIVELVPMKLPPVGERTRAAAHAPTGACILAYFPIVSLFDEVADRTDPLVDAPEVLYTLGLYIIEFLLDVDWHPVLVL